MSLLTAQLVDSISDTATVRLDLNDHVTWKVLVEGTSTPAPPLRRVVASSPMVDGDRYAGASHGNRVVTVALSLLPEDFDQAAAALQTLARELHRQRGFLRWRVGTTEPVYFRLSRGEFGDVRWKGGAARRVTVNIPADPYAYGPELFPFGAPLAATFDEVTANGWGPPWTGFVGGALSEYSAPAGRGLHTHNANNVTHESQLDTPTAADVLVTVDRVGVSAAPTGDNVEVDVVTRAVGSSFVGCRLFVRADNTVQIAVRQVLGGVETVSGFATVPAVTASTPLAVRVEALGPIVRAKAWTSGGAPPFGWQAQLTGVTVRAAGAHRLRTRLAGGNTNAKPYTVDFDGFRLTPCVGVVEDPHGAPGPALNANPYFETDALSWSAVGGTFVRSTAQFHQGAASGLLTPDGVTANTRAVSESVPATAGVAYRLSAWLRCAAARNINLQSIFFDSGAVSLGTTTTTVALPANTWTLAELTVTAPANTATGILRVEMTSTPLVSHLLHIDEAMLREASGAGAMWFDVPAIGGDVETPMILKVDHLDGGTIDGTAIGIRRAANVADTPFVSQAETWGGFATGTALQPNDATASGAGSNFVRITFPVGTAMADRMSVTHPAVPTDATRGLYRVFARVRQSAVSGDTTIRLQLRREQTANDPVAMPANPTLWHWVDLGYIPVPGGADPATDYAGRPIMSGSVPLWLQAERVGPTALTVDVDVFVYVPADDGFAFLTWAGLSVTSGGLTVWDGTRDTAYALDMAGRAAAVKPPVALPAIPRLAPGVSNRVFMVKHAASIDEATLASPMRLEVSYHPRYLFVRPLAG